MEIREEDWVSKSGAQDQLLVLLRDGRKIVGRGIKRRRGLAAKFAFKPNVALLSHGVESFHGDKELNKRTLRGKGESVH